MGYLHYPLTHRHPVCSVLTPPPNIGLPHLKPRPSVTNGKPKQTESSWAERLNHAVDEKRSPFVLFTAGLLTHQMCTCDKSLSPYLLPFLFAFSLLHLWSLCYHVLPHPSTLSSRLMQVGEEFCGSKSEVLQESIKRQSVNYFKNYHRWDVSISAGSLPGLCDN